MKSGFTSAIQVLLAFTLIQICFASTGSGLDVLPAAPGHSDDFNINLDLGNGKVYNTKSYRDVLTFLENAKGSCSCFRLAAHTMIKLCKSIEHSNSIDVVLANLKEEFAAKLAVCELKAVHSKGKDAVPKACKKFLPAKHACTKGSDPNKLCYAPVNRVEVIACISALEARAQSWTSYSNALQNVQNTCQASRLAIEKDHLIDQLKAVIETAATAQQTTTDTFDSLAAWVGANFTQLQKVQNELEVSVQQGWSNLSNEMTEYTQRSFFNMLAGLDTYFTNMTSLWIRQGDAAIKKNNQALQTADLVKSTVQGTLYNAKDLATKQDVFYDKTHLGNAQILAAQEKMQSHTKFMESAHEAERAATSDHLSQLWEMKQHANDLSKIARDISSRAQNISDALAPAAAAAHVLAKVSTLNVLMYFGVGISGILVIIFGYVLRFKSILSLNGWLVTYGTLGSLLAVFNALDIPEVRIVCRLPRFFELLWDGITSPWVAPVSLLFGARKQIIPAFKLIAAKLVRRNPGITGWVSTNTTAQAPVAVPNAALTSALPLPVRTNGVAQVPVVGHDPSTPGLAQAPANLHAMTRNLFFPDTPRRKTVISRKVNAGWRFTIRRDRGDTEPAQDISGWN